MTTAVYRSSPAMSVPLTQNTAPVLEFSCLYTHDAHKKQRKWQDGFLRFHTFNKRVMVYDVPRNYIGDMHWTRSEDLQIGHEITLERGGVLVEVGESIGQTETDLSALRKSKPKTNASAAPSPSVGSTRGLKGSTNRPRSTMPGDGPLKHKSLNTLLGASRGPIGKAQLPTRSPFEERHALVENQHWEPGPPPKRMRMDSQSASREDVGTRTPALVEIRRSVWPLTSNTAGTKTKPCEPPELPQPVIRETIDLSSDDTWQGQASPGSSSEVLDSSPSFAKKANGRPLDSLPSRSSSPAFQMQNLPLERGRVSDNQAVVPRGHTKVWGKRDAVDLSKPVERTAFGQTRCKQQFRRIGGGNIDCAGTDSPQHRVVSSEEGRMIRLPSTGSKKRSLLCHDQLVKKPRQLPHIIHEEPRATGEQPECALPNLRDQVAARLARINANAERSRFSSSSGLVDPVSIRETSSAIRDATLRDAPNAVVMPRTSEYHEYRTTSDDLPGERLARLDKLMLPPPAPQPEIFRIRPQDVLHESAVPAFPSKEKRSLRRIQSDSARQRRAERVPGAPVRYTPSPTRRSREGTSASVTHYQQRLVSPAKDARSSTVARSSPDRTAYKKKGPLQKSVSLNIRSNGTSTVILGKLFQSPGRAPSLAKHSEQPDNLGPWSREAFDLFTWRPPGWDEGAWCSGERTTEDSNKRRLTTSNKSAAPLALSGGAGPPMCGRPVV